MLRESLHRCCGPAPVLSGRTYTERSNRSRVCRSSHVTCSCAETCNDEVRPLLSGIFFGHDAHLPSRGLVLQHLLPACGGTDMRSLKHVEYFGLATFWKVRKDIDTCFICLECGHILEQANDLNIVKPGRKRPWMRVCDSLVTWTCWPCPLCGSAPSKQHLFPPV